MSFAKQKPKISGFTLIEVLLVFAIISLLSSIILASTKSSKDRARTAKGLEFSQTVYHRLGAEAVGIWGFEEGSGTTVNDASGFNNNGTFVGATPPSFVSDTPFQILGQGSGKFALRFDSAIDHYVNIPNFQVNVAELTIEFWMKDEGTTTNWRKYVHIQQSPIDSRVSIEIDATNQQVRFITRVAGVGYDGPSAPLTPGFNHYAFVLSKSGNYKETYKNGGLVNRSSNWPGDFTTTYGRMGQLTKSVIDDVRIYNTALSSAEIQKHYAEGLERHQFSSISDQKFPF